MAGVHLTPEPARDHFHVIARAALPLPIFPMPGGRWRVFLPQVVNRSQDRQPPDMEEIEQLVAERGPSGMTLSDPSLLATFRCYRRSTKVVGATVARFARWSALVRTLVVDRDDGAAEGALRDPALQAHRSYGALRSRLVLVRPDGYVACTAPVGRPEVLERYLRRLIIRPPGPSVSARRLGHEDRSTTPSLSD